MTENSLWHSKEKMPKNGSRCVWKYTKEQKQDGRGWFDSGRYDSCYDCFCTTPSFFVDRGKNNLIEKWCYLSDLLSLEQQLQAKEEEIEHIKFQLKAADFGLEQSDTTIQELERNIVFNKKTTEFYKDENKSLQTKLQQAKEGLEFYAKAKHFEEHSYYDIMLEWGEKARETLEMINKE